MSAQATDRRAFDPALDSARGTYLSNGRGLFEVLGSRGLDPAGKQEPGPRAALLLLDCAMAADDQGGLEDAASARWFGLGDLRSGFVRIEPRG